jgi:signal transduction histidine kinase
VTGRAWRLYASVGSLLIVAYFLLPTVEAKDLLYITIVASSATAMIATAVPRRAGNRNGRLLLGAGLALWFGGEAVWTVYEVFLHQEPPFPSVADAMYLASYPLFASALLVLVGGWRRIREVALEALAVSVGAGAAVWVFFAHQYFHSARDGLTKTVAVASPAGDVLLLAALTSAYLLRGRLSTATRLLLAGIVATLVADLAYSIDALADTYATGDLLDGGWMTFYLCWGIAAVHPSMDDPPAGADGPARYGLRRLSVLVAAGVLPPLTLLYLASDHRYAELPVLAAMSVLAFGLVGARVAYLWRMAERDARVLAERQAELEAAFAHLERLQRMRAELLRATVRATEEERIRVSADLHDGPVQALTATVLRAGALENRLGAAGEDAARSGVVAIREQVAQQIAEIRRVIADLRPPELDRGLTTALRGLVEAFARRTECDVRLDADGEERVPPEIETVLFRITQEALANVAKHAQAMHVAVHVRFDRGEVAVSIRDDGAGFTPPMNGEHVREGHYGLAGMRERVEAADGRLEVTSEPGAGTQIVARIPTTPTPLAAA